MGGAGAAWAMQGMTGASAPMPPSQKMSNLFSAIDTSGSGSISKAQFQQAFSQMNPPASFKSLGAEAIFAKLDPSGTGSVSKQDFINGMTNMMSELRQQRHHHHAGAQAATPTPAQTTTASLSSLGQMIGSNINTSA